MSFVEKLEAWRSAGHPSEMRAWSVASVISLEHPYSAWMSWYADGKFLSLRKAGRTIDDAVDDLLREFNQVVPKPNPPQPG